MVANYKSNGMMVIIYILIINLIIAFLYMYIKFKKDDLECGIIMGGFIILCPLVGPLYLFFSWIIYEIYFKRKACEVNREELSLRKEKIEIFLKPDIRKALDKVPMEEALIISDKKNRRKLLLDMLRDEKEDYLKSILKAIEHSDSEVSHYAATAISDTINEFKIREKELREKYNKDKVNNELCDEYLGYLSNFLLQKILSESEERFYCSLFEELIVNMEEYLPYKVSGKVYNKLVCVLLDLHENHKAKAWAEKALINHENDLDSYKAGLRYYYTNENMEGFLALIEKLRKSDVVLDHDTLEMVRFFSH